MFDNNNIDRYYIFKMYHLFIIKVYEYCFKVYVQLKLHLN